ncbi:MAG TPA: phospholipase D-like domain-containing protein [Nocardioidaceae bacterium]|nr:phospholipase D-like domain-containing protein [Nocardioidaceae bacterium]
MFARRLAVLASGPAFLLGPLWPGWGGPPSHPGRTESLAALAHARGAQSVHPVVHPEVSSPGWAAFNDPTGPRRRQYVLVHRVNLAIRGAWPGSTIRVAEYSFQMPSTAGALVDAHRRGVHVQVVVDDHARHWPSVRRLRHALGTDPHRSSFLRICQATCRGGRGNQHAKFLTFSATGNVQHVVMTGSVNFTNYNARVQWNDLYTVPEDSRLYRQFGRVFAMMVRDRPQPRARLPAAGEGFRTLLSPLPHYSPENDPVAAILRRVRCTTGDRPTVVRIAMHAWNGTRGVALAHHVATLQAEGCDVRVLYGIGMGGRVAGILRAAGVPLRDSAYRGRHVHEKVLLVSGGYGDQRDAHYVWTGSHNWSNRSLRNDELILRVAGADVVHAYRRNFHRMWSLAAHGG